MGEVKQVLVLTFQRDTGYGKLEILGCLLRWVNGFQVLFYKFFFRVGTGLEGSGLVLGQSLDEGGEVVLGLADHENKRPVLLVSGWAWLGPLYPAEGLFAQMSSAYWS